MSLFNSLKAKIKNLKINKKIVGGTALAGMSLVLVGTSIGSVAKMINKDSKKSTADNSLPSYSDYVQPTTESTTDLTETTTLETDPAETTTTTVEDGFLSDSLDADTTLDDELSADYLFDSSTGDILVDEDGNVIPEDDFSDDVVVDGNFFIAPDGQVWASEEEYNSFVSGQNSNEYVEVNTGAYLAPDGNYYESEEDYLNVVNGNNQTPIEDYVEVEEDNSSDGFFRGPDGLLYVSEEAYNELVDNGLVENTDNGDVTPEEPIETPDVPAEEPSENIDDNFEGYVAPDGTYWDSKEVYEEYANSLSEDYYVDADGNIWLSEQDYIDFNNLVSNVTDQVEEPVEDVNTTTEPTEDVNTTTEPTEEPTEDVTTTTEPTEEPVEDVNTTTEPTEEPVEDVTTTTEPTEEPVEDVTTTTEPAEEPTEDEVGQGINDENDYYVDENGNYWVSYEDYLECTSQVAETAKQR